MTPLVSIIIPTYNHARFLGKAVQSVVEQSYSNWEALVIDNHSDDNTLEVVAGFSDPRIRLLRIHNGGIIAASRNLGLREAKGEWIAFLDSDDIWYSGKLSSVMTTAGGMPDCEVFSTDELMKDADTGKTTVLRYGPFRKNFYRSLLVDGNCLSTSATVVNAGFLSDHEIVFRESPEHVTVEDYGFWLDLARHGARFTFIHEIHGEYLIHGENSSMQLARHWKNGHALLHDHVFRIQVLEESPSRLWRLVQPRIEFWEIRDLVLRKNLRRALVLTAKTFAASPAGTVRFLWGKIRPRLTRGGSRMRTTVHDPRSA